jgi:hypothetical protein
MKSKTNAFYNSEIFSILSQLQRVYIKLVSKT